jgi:hypothetical protein
MGDEQQQEKRPGGANCHSRRRCGRRPTSRGNTDAAEYKHVALGQIFLKYISYRFEERRAQAFTENPPNLAEEFAEDRGWYTSESVFWVPEKARWDFIKAKSTSVEPTIGQLIDDAMVALENENPSLKGVLTKNYAWPELDQVRPSCSLTSPSGTSTKARTYSVASTNTSSGSLR